MLERIMINAFKAIAAIALVIAVFRFALNFFDELNK